MARINSDSELTGSPKFLDLTARLKVGPRDTFWFMHHFWFWVSAHYQEGVLENVSDFAIAHSSQWEGEPKAFVDALIDVGFLDRGPGKLTVHDWDHWRPEWVRSRIRRTTDKRPDNDRSTTSSQHSSSPVVVSFPVSGKTEKSWELRQDYVEKLGEIYPGVDVTLEAKRALAWIEANLSKRKTASGMPRFLMSWMARTQDRGGTRGGSGSSPSDDKQRALDETTKRVSDLRRKADAIIERGR